MKKLNNKGFGAVEVLLILVIVGIIGGIGWYVAKGPKKADQTVTNTSSAPVAKPKTDTYKVPTGYIVYENKELGFKFVYPKEYSPFAKAKSSDKTVIDYFASIEPKKEYAPGVTGKISFTSTLTSQQFSTFKYGPEVKYVDGVLTVVSINPADTANKVGKTFKNFDGTTAKIQKNGDLSIVVIKGGDEGRYSATYSFLLNGKLILIDLPTFDSNTFLCPVDGCHPNDPTKNNLMQKQILESIVKI